MNGEVEMAKPKKPPPANVIKLVTSNEKQNKAKALPPQPVPQEREVPWHVHIATWALRWRAKDDDVFDMMTPQETRFLARMTIWDGEATPNQTRWLKGIENKVLTIIAVTDPNPAA
jgi:hypothetical protein